MSEIIDSANAGKIIGADQPKREKIRNLTYAEAIQALDRGMVVRLPEWKGFWFKPGKYIHVLTKDNEYHDTAWLQNYQDRNDWEIMQINAELGHRMIKAIRMHLEALEGQIDTLLGKSRELSIVKTNLWDAFMWLGHMLGEFGSENPYKKFNDHNSPLIGDLVDVSTDSIYEYVYGKFKKLDKTARVKVMRKMLQGYFDYIGWILVVIGQRIKVRSLSPIVSAGPAACIHIMNAKNWLGMELQNIKETQDSE